MKFKKKNDFLYIKYLILILMHLYETNSTATSIAESVNLEVMEIPIESEQEIIYEDDALLELEKPLIHRSKEKLLLSYNDFHEKYSTTSKAISISSIFYTCSYLSSIIGTTLNAYKCVSEIDLVHICLFFTTSIVVHHIIMGFDLPYYMYNKNNNILFINTLGISFFHTICLFTLGKISYAREVANFNTKEVEEERKKEYLDKLPQIKNSGLFILINTFNTFIFEVIKINTLLIHPQKRYFAPIINMNNEEFHTLIKSKEPLLKKEFKAVNFRFLTNEAGISGGVFFFLRDETGQRILINSNLEESDKIFSEFAFNIESNTLGLPLYSKIMYYISFRTFLISGVSIGGFIILQPILGELLIKFNGTPVVVFNPLYDALAHRDWNYLVVDKNQNLTKLRFNIEVMKQQMYFNNKPIENIIDFGNEILEVFASLTSKSSVENKKDAITKILSIFTKLQRYHLSGEPGAGKTYFTVVLRKILEDVYLVVDKTIIASGILSKRDVPTYTLIYCYTPKSYDEIAMHAIEMNLQLQDPYNRDSIGRWVPNVGLIGKIKKMFSGEANPSTPVYAMIVYDDMPDLTGSHEHSSEILKTISHVVKSILGLNTVNNTAIFNNQIQRVNGKGTSTKQHANISIMGQKYEITFYSYSKLQTSMCVTTNYGTDENGGAVATIDRFCVKAYKGSSELQDIEAIILPKNSSIYFQEDFITILVNDQNFTKHIHRTLEMLYGKLGNLSKEHHKQDIMESFFSSLSDDSTLFSELKRKWLLAALNKDDLPISILKILLQKAFAAYTTKDYHTFWRYVLGILVIYRQNYKLSVAIPKINQKCTNTSDIPARDIMIEFLDLLSEADKLETYAFSQKNKNTTSSHFFSSYIGSQIIEEVLRKYMKNITERFIEK